AQGAPAVARVNVQAGQVIAVLPNDGCDAVGDRARQNTYDVFGITRVGNHKLVVVRPFPDGHQIVLRVVTDPGLVDGRHVAVGVSQAHQDGAVAGQDAAVRARLDVPRVAVGVSVVPGAPIVVYGAAKPDVERPRHNGDGVIRLNQHVIGDDARVAIQIEPELPVPPDFV